MRLLHVIGTRPNFVKQAPVISAIGRHLPGADQVIVHTGQHYDRMMSEIFFEQLGVPEPDHMLDVGSGSHAQQTARVMERLEPVLTREKPDLLLVPGDVNSTLAAALTASKLGIEIAHIESGLRSFDRTMPEEVNRVLVDQISSLLFIHSPEAVDNLRNEGIGGDHIHFVGNTMIDSLVAMRDRIREAAAAARHGHRRGDYLLVTLHRPALVDGPLLADAIARLREVGERLPVIFPVHPRTRARIDSERIEIGSIELIDPVGYIDFLSLVSDAGAVLTDSGGIQEETTFLGVPCLTLLGLDPAAILEIPAALEAGSVELSEPPPLWDGQAADRLAAVIRERF